MAEKRNPLKLNALQLKTLTVLQILAEDSNHGVQDEATGMVQIGQMPHAHGNHFHAGGGVILTSDTTGLSNPAVFRVLQRKGLVQPGFPMGLTVTAAGMAYDTGMRDKILHGTDH
ncbi:MAG: hypothetical protein HOH66_11635 [Rhodospirillaceae bacterium]|jgi:hypothetical protein|nr:hypothetical protein [Rhodospirillaceae bacterium]MBT6118506.1 hypothetical protein [Rhodospirillaceae bacterium]